MERITMQQIPLEQFQHSAEVAERYCPLLEDLGIRADGMEPLDVMLLHAHVCKVEHFEKACTAARTRWSNEHPEVPEAHKQFQVGAANIDWPRTVVANMTTEERRALAADAVKNSPVTFRVRN